jgi:hypothetical protein
MNKLSPAGRKSKGTAKASDALVDDYKNQVHQRHGDLAGPMLLVRTPSTRQ